ncbi:hypothetical protein ES319_A03G131000v1 [Gossypium barbadense]|uniref:Uncharacterized protein n=1 Tax=Gossypium barbadense TaxID=3634 RepID=A0A5J5WER9_GOSBA|nr:hypothetical protein ES319_A03G131000v1 [Gossypium barbadense]
MTPRSDRPTRETKVVERYSAPSVARSSSFKKKEHPFSFSLRLDGCKELMSGMEVAKDQELVDGTVAQESGKSMPSSQQEVLIQALRPKLQELRRKEDAIARVNGIANFLVLLNQVTEIPFNNFLYCWNKS